MGGFGVLLQENSSLLSTFGYSSIADNILLDMIAGLGLLSIPFFVWLVTISKGLYISKSNNVEYKLFFVILTVNFMFNHIYVIPVILWMWFAALGLWQEKESNVHTQ